MKHINPIKHTTAENYEHFLSYMYGAGARHNALLCQAYFDGSDAPHEEYEAYMAAHPEPMKQDTPYCKSVPMCAKPCGDESCVEPMKREPVAWMYCPECGSLDVRYEDGNHKQCASCAQEWFSDIDYSDVVRQNLNRLHAALVDAKAIRAEALEEAAMLAYDLRFRSCWTAEAIAAAIRKLK